MAETYANNIENIRRNVAQTKGDEASSMDALSNLVRTSYADKLADFKEKWGGVEQIGGAIQSVAPLLRTGRQLYDKYKQIRDGITQSIDPVDDSLPDTSGGEGNALSDAGFSEEDAEGLFENDKPESGGNSISETSFSTSTPTPVDSQPLPDAQPTTLSKSSVDGVEDDPFQSGYSNEIPVRSSFQQGGLSSTADDLAEQTTSNIKSSLTDLADAGTEGLADAGADLAGYFTADAISSAIPVVGEVASSVIGLATIGSAIGELISHHNQTPSIHPVALSLPSNLTSKYSDSLPSADGVIQRASSSSVF
jgi:uncharacterized phage infection (PIP) family protein YhgE